MQFRDDRYYYFSYNSYCSAYLEKEFCRLINGFVESNNDCKYYMNKHGITFIWEMSVKKDFFLYYDRNLLRVIL